MPVQSAFLDLHPCEVVTFAKFPIFNKLFFILRFFMSLILEILKSMGNINTCTYKVNFTNIYKAFNCYKNIRVHFMKMILLMFLLNIKYLNDITKIKPYCVNWFVVKFSIYKNTTALVQTRWLYLVITTKFILMR